MSKFYFPDDLVTDILSRLPVKSLLQFKCVSKSWYLIIDNPEFINMHEKRSEGTESNSKLIAGVLCNRAYKFYVVDFNFHESYKRNCIEEIKYPSVMDGNDNRIMFIGSCNGLICLVYSKRDRTTVLWNPATRKHFQLPVCCSKQYRIVTVHDECSYGFGYDEVTNDYKVVRLVKYYDPDNRPEFFSEFLIYSLKSNKWRSLDDFSYGNDLNVWFDGVLVNGALHWLLKDRSILAFNLATEGFKLFPTPENSNKFCKLCTPVFGGYQHLIFGNFFSEVWVMKDYGSKDSWTKLTMELSIDKKLTSLMPTEYFSKFVTYDLEEQSFREVKFPCTVKHVKACVYFESLVCLDAGRRSHGNFGDSREQNMRTKEDKESEGITATEENSNLFSAES